MIIVRNNCFVISIALTALRFVGFWKPNGLDSAKTFIYYTYGFIIFMSILGSYIIFQAVDLYLVWGDIGMMTATAFLLLTNFAQTLKIIVTIKDRKRIGSVISENDLVLKREDRVEGLDIVRRCNLELKVLFVIYMVFTTVTLTGWANSAEHKQLPMRAWYPYDTTKTPAYELTYLHQIGAIFVAAYLNIAKDCLTFSLIAQVRCRLQLLNLSLRTLHDDVPINMGKPYDPLSSVQDERVLQKLHTCIKEHQKALEAASEIQGCFSEAISLQFFVSMDIICATAFQLASQTRNLVRFLSMGTYLINMIYQVFLYCYQGHQLRDESIKLSEGAYQSSWCRGSLKFRRCLLTLMIRCQRPVLLKAGGFLTLTLQCFMAIVKTSYSFFTLLQNIGEK